MGEPLNQPRRSWQAECATNDAVSRFSPAGEAQRKYQMRLAPASRWLRRARINTVSTSGT